MVWEWRSIHVQVPGACASAAGTHAAGGSRASTPTSPLEAGSLFDDMPTYLIDVLEEIGDDAARRCYWDMGPWSDLTRVWRPLGKPSARVTFKVPQFPLLTLSNHSPRGPVHVPPDLLGPPL